MEFLQIFMFQYDLGIKFRIFSLWRRCRIIPHGSDGTLINRSGMAGVEDLWSHTEKISYIQSSFTFVLVPQLRSRTCVLKWSTAVHSVI